MRFLGILILVGGIVSGIVLFKNWRVDAEHERWIDDTKVRVEALLRPAGRESSLLPNEVDYFKLQHFLQKAEAAGQSADSLVTDALEAMKVSEQQAAQVKFSIVEGFTLMKKHKVFDDLATAVALENGEAPAIKSGPFKDQKLVLSQIVPPTVAPSIARHPANLRLLPEALRDARDSLDLAATPGILNVAANLRDSKVITQEEYDRVKAAVPEKK
jgi:hypothetical protein